jgi:hypothetical protein
VIGALLGNGPASASRHLPSRHDPSGWIVNAFRRLTVRRAQLRLPVGGHKATFAFGFVPRVLVNG